jgi:hypothetical protein
MTTTASGYQKTAVKKQLLQAIMRRDLEPACHWCAELVKSGQYMDVWKMALFVFGKHVHAASPKLVLYLQMRADSFRALAASSPDESLLHSMPDIRKLFAEMMCLLCASPRTHAVELVSVDPRDFQLASLKGKAPVVEVVLKPGDPLQLVAPLNELHYALKTRHSHDARYWFEWLLAFAHANKSVKAATRDFLNGRTELVWIFWEMIFANIVKGSPPEKYAKAALRLFCMQFTGGNNHNEFRHFLSYFAITLVCDAIDLALPLPMDKPAIQAVCLKIGALYDPAPLTRK